MVVVIIFVVVVDGVVVVIEDVWFEMFIFEGVFFGVGVKCVDGENDVVKVF